MFLFLPNIYSFLKVKKSFEVEMIREIVNYEKVSWSRVEKAIKAVPNPFSHKMKQEKKCPLQIFASN